MPSLYHVFGRQIDAHIFLKAFGVLIDYGGVASSRPGDAIDLVEKVTELLQFPLQLFDCRLAFDLTCASGSSWGRYGWPHLLPGHKMFRNKVTSRIPSPTFPCQWTSLYIYTAVEGVFRTTVATLLPAVLLWASSRRPAILGGDLPEQVICNCWQNLPLMLYCRSRHLLKEVTPWRL
jgi:hypothetical protein